MKKTVLALLAILALSLAIVAGASASGGSQWWHHTLPNNHVTCNKSNTTPNAADAGPFASKSACLASNGDGGNGNPAPTGWPGTSGVISGNGSGGCDGADVILTSDENAPGYGAFDFDITPGQEFQNIGLDFDFDVLSGTQAQSEPYFIVRFTDATQAFVYSVDVNPGQPGDQTFSLTGNTYITRDEAMEQWGDKIVSSVTLAVDNGNLSIAAHGLASDDCPVEVPITPETFEQVDRVTACASTPILRVADGTLGIFTDLDEATYDSGVFQGVTFTASLFVQGIGATCDVPAGYHYAGHGVDGMGNVDPTLANNIHPLYVPA